jgi:hypothetical protein
MRRIGLAVALVSDQHVRIEAEDGKKTIRLAYVDRTLARWATRAPRGRQRGRAWKNHTK